jgi:hypothetical protein
MKRPTKHSDGMYHMQGKKYPVLKGSRRLVWNKTAFKTMGGLTRSKLMMNKHGRIVSRKKHFTEKKNKRLEKAGFKPKKGTFKAFKKSDAKKTRRSKK